MSGILSYAQLVGCTLVSPTLGINLGLLCNCMCFRLYAFVNDLNYHGGDKYQVKKWLVTSFTLKEKQTKVISCFGIVNM